jgi:hypothetical protein
MPGAWLTKVASRSCLNLLGSAPGPARDLRGRMDPLTAAAGGYGTPKPVPLPRRGRP